jgi:hypothetical protein
LMENVGWKFKALKITVLGQNCQVHHIIADGGATPGIITIFFKDTKGYIVNAEIGIWRYIDPGSQDFIRFCYHRMDFITYP